MSAPEFQMDALDRKANEAFPGYLVRKDLVRRYAGSTLSLPTSSNSCWAATARASIRTRSTKVSRS